MQSVQINLAKNLFKKEKKRQQAYAMTTREFFMIESP
jgi:hypothetical protein